MIPALLVIPVFSVAPMNDIPIPVLNQSRGKMAWPDMVPGAIVVGSDIPHAPPGCVVIVVD